MRIFRSLLATVGLLSAGILCAQSGAKLYVDALPAEAGSGWDGVDGHAYTGALGAGSGYATVQAALNAMGSGDDVYLRGGVYSATYNAKYAFKIPADKDGTATNWCSIQSYPGEWAVLKGNSGTRNVLGLDDGAGTTYVNYWKIDRLEIMGGSVGINVSGGPVEITRCYIHGNLGRTTDVFSGIGIIGYVLRDSLIADCYLRDNGNFVRNLSIKLIADYQHRHGNDYNNPYDPERCLRNTVVRNNLIDGDPFVPEAGIHFKSQQYLTSHSSVNWAQGDWGCNVHHNILLNQKLGIFCNQDFAQIHHNIITSSAAGIDVNEEGGSGDLTAVTIYNNTLIGGGISSFWGYFSYAPYSTVTPYLSIINNIVDSDPADDNSSITLRKSNTGYSVDLARLNISHNYIYRALPHSDGSVSHLLFLKNESFPCGRMTVAQYQAGHGRINFARNAESPSDLLYKSTSGSDRFVTRAGHVMQGSATIGAGGKGGAHPYLPGVMIPSYVGAVDPASPQWVDDVLALGGMGSAGDKVLPSVPTGISAIATNSVTVSLSWNPSTDNICVSDYEVFRNGVKIATVDSPSFTDIGLPPSSVYSYTIVARDAAGNRSAASAAVSATTPIITDFQAPTQPLHLSFTIHTSYSLTLKWDASTDLPSTGGVGVREYRVYRNGVHITSVPTPTFSETELTPITSYRYRISAVDYAGSESALSDELTVTLPAQQILYVDSLPAEAGSKWNGINGGTYEGSPGVGRGYGSVQAALDAMAPGDDIFLRGGTYIGSHSEKYGFKIPANKNGGVSNWSSIQSYPGEWAVLDGNATASNVIGLTDDSGTTPVHYWRFERLEIRRGKGIGLNVSGGPVHVRWCYLHGNRSTDVDVFRAGIIGYVLRDSILEYCYIKDNGNATRNIGVKFVADYRHRLGDDFPNPLTADECLRSTSVRYCVFEGDPARADDTAINFKAKQYLTAHTNVDWTHADWGNKIHHNLFLDHSTAITCNQDFAQIFQNVFRSRGMAVQINEAGSMGALTGISIYNNTISGGIIASYWGPMHYAPWSIKTPYLYVLNNVFDRAPATNSNYAITLREEEDRYVLQTDRLELSHNYMHRSLAAGGGSVYHLRFLDNTGHPGGAMTVGDYQAAYGWPNFARDVANLTDPLIPVGATAAAALVVRKGHGVQTGKTIGSAGRGGAHPYLPGVMIPQYLGATNPDDHAWVAGVYGLMTLNSSGAPLAMLTAPAGDPSWIEGSTPGNHTPVLTPTGSRSTPAGQQLQIKVQGTDADGNTLLYSATGGVL